MVERSVLHLVAISRLKSGFDERVDGSVVLSLGCARRLLGERVKVPRDKQLVFLKELEGVGLLEFVNSQSVRLL